MSEPAFRPDPTSPSDCAENHRRMLAGELYYCWTPDLVQGRARCKSAMLKYNTEAADGETSRRRVAELLMDLLQDPTPLPPKLSDPEQDAAQFDDFPYIDTPVKMDYGSNVKLGKGVYMNSSCTLLDVCPITIGARTLIGPNVNFYSATHPIDPVIRNGMRGPELGKPIAVGEDCWFGGSVVVLPGVTIGRGVVVGAGSVVTKDVEDFVVVAGNPARVVKRLDVEREKYEAMVRENKERGH
ncbi:trimeric LpxA-like protein [Neurospora tetraspora]|uniref:Trimeric LpxA-like protein n=1 Tax=Neurospora tetraspora TaxID=94610 RepID=A0AAE0JGC3_9PEZI|nr:trimeric LpxA-like protein [Neurospora tetraspora]